MDSETQVFPLILNLKELVKGPTFVAGVVARLHIVMKADYEQWWMYGVNPGGIAEGGDTQETAYLKFLRAFREVLADIASDCHTYEEFLARANAFIMETNDSERADWEAARKAIRAGKPVTDEYVEKLKRVVSDEAPCIEAVRLDVQATAAPEQENMVSEPCCTDVSKANCASQDFLENSKQLAA